MTSTLADLLLEFHERLSSSSDTPSLDAQVLAAHVLAKPRAWILAHPQASITAEQRRSLEQALERLVSGEPLPYILGHWEFFGFDFLLTPATLIPRPETELLVEHALAWLRRNPERRRVADVGTGSGCIAITLAAHIEDVKVIASDISLAALQVARQNAQRHSVAARLAFIQSDLLPHTAAPYHLICANLPYIPTRTLLELDVYRKEPRLALDGGRQGLDLIARLLARISSHPDLVAAGGIILLEIEASQAASSRALTRRLLPGAEVDLLQDLAGRDRLLAIQI